VKTGQRYFPLAELGSVDARFDVINSPLSEFAVLGFEFGYSLASPYALTIWEAQFGDFVNGAQVVIDQFISSCEDKWNRVSGLTLFLPHGYEGQGPEHSSARLERWLQLCAEDNMQVCNLTTPAQMFHVLRRQVIRKWRKPLIIMTPKSLLRLRASFSPLEDLTQGSFARVIPDVHDDETAAAARRVLLCSGRLYYDLAAAVAEHERDDVAVVRIEQLYPFPVRELQAALARHPNAEEYFWVQDEPRNMGAWTFVEHHVSSLLDGRRPRFVGRAESASPATGTPESHKLEHEMILEEAFNT
jgi:2-oxoglutarate dehydrogenase E1 component